MDPKPIGKKNLDLLYPDALVMIKTPNGVGLLRTVIAINGNKTVKVRPFGDISSTPEDINPDDLCFPESFRVIEVTLGSVRPIDPQLLKLVVLEISGRIKILLSPVRDFDSLLDIDNVLGKIPNLGGVSLADYAQNQVTFRVEIASSITISDLISNLEKGINSERSIHKSFTPLSFTDGELQIRIE